LRIVQYSSGNFTQKLKLSGMGFKQGLIKENTSPVSAATGRIKDSKI
jgi:hypothetical protein